MIEEGIFELKATAGNTHLGGEDFNNRLVNLSANTRRVFIIIVPNVWLTHFHQISPPTPMLSIVSALLASMLNILVCCHPNLY